MLLFAGTTEGRQLYELLKAAEIDVFVCVATDYGKEIIDKNNDKILAKRLDRDQMKALIISQNHQIVIDATHPYAVEVTKNIKAACKELDVEYIRLLRSEGEQEGTIFCQSINEAVELLSSSEGNILSTIGSKELSLLKKIDDWQRRVYARILPLPDALKECIELGFNGSHLICMQGPFSHELNLAMLKQYECRYLLTKNSGSVGGFEEKLSAARAANARVVLIGRPLEETGFSFDEAVKYIFSRED